MGHPVGGPQTTGAIALQRCDQFVGRTTNWLYDHLRNIPRYEAVVFCDHLVNRVEFPELRSWSINSERLIRRAWRRVAGNQLHPIDRWRVNRLAPCVLHSHFGHVATGDFVLQQALGVPWFVSFYGADVHQLGRQAEWRSKYARLFNQCNRALALGPVMKAALERLGCPPEKVTIHPLGVDVANLPACPRVLKRGDPLRILFAGTFREKKGISYLVEAVALARRAGVRLQLQLVGDEAAKPGDRETKRAVFERIRELGIEDLVVHQSFLPFAELVALALRSHVFVAPSVTADDGDSEGTPFVVQQMMATEMPVIATRHSDNPYLFGEQAHLLVPERDAAAIADKLKRYVDDPQLLTADGVALRDRMCHAFEVRKCAASLSSLYDAVS
jgi:colanic acid/amylovoran biosynthesis glycosyltransferase